MARFIASLWRLLLWPVSLVVAVLTLPCSTGSRIMSLFTIFTWQRAEADGHLRTHVMELTHKLRPGPDYGIFPSITTVTVSK